MIPDYKLFAAGKLLGKIFSVFRYSYYHVGGGFIIYNIPPRQIRGARRDILPRAGIDFAFIFGWKKAVLAAARPRGPAHGIVEFAVDRPSGVGCKIGGVVNHSTAASINQGCPGAPLRP
jgi:hypothetical protein